MKLEDVVTLWELNGQIVAMVNPDGDNEAFFQIHPAFQDTEFDLLEPWFKEFGD